VRGRDAAVALAIWAAFNAALAGLLLGFRHNWVQVADYWLAVAGVLAYAGLSLLARDRGVRRLPEASAGAAILALAVVLLFVGASVGLFAALIGAGLAVVALVVLVRERLG
jgi:hypothetical protein